MRPGPVCLSSGGPRLNLTGIDLSQRSIEYAKARNPEIEYRVGDYTEPLSLGQFDAVLLVYGDYCVLSPGKRRSLKAGVALSLKPSGRFVLDVTTRAHRVRVGTHFRWQAASHGFWRPGPHLMLQQGFDYPEADLWLDQYVVVDADGAVSVYRNWFQDFNLESICAELAEAGITVAGAWGDLAGAPYREGTEWIGLICQKSD